MKHLSINLKYLRKSCVAASMLAALSISAQTQYDIFAGPWIFSGYRSIPEPKGFSYEITPTRENWVYNDGPQIFETEEELSDYISSSLERELAETLRDNEEFRDYYQNLDRKEREEWMRDATETRKEEYLTEVSNYIENQRRLKSLLQEMTAMQSDYVPGWLRDALKEKRMAQNLMYSIMVNNPDAIEYAYWNLPEPPRLPDEDHSFSTYIKSLQLPEIDENKTRLETAAISKRHWLHNAQAGIQFSQAYVSSNWYQGGNDYLALLLNALWDVQLNKVYHPDLMFQSTVSYKLGINSTPPDSYHKYSISEDLFQWNLKSGIKAFKDFFWSYNLLFKTQLFRNYEPNSDLRTASFLSPGELNMGIGMSYSYSNKYKTLNVGVSLSPLSYNLKTCIDSRIDPTKFNIEPGHKAHSEIGSNAEVNVEWTVASNISSRTRFFAFTDYRYFQGDIETTWNFQVNRFLSTQIYLHLRYDSSSDPTVSKWKHWMLKEILSFGLSYTFSTKP